MNALNTKVWSDISGRATLILAAVAGVFLIAMTTLISLAVIMRYLVGQPILGVNEIVQLIAVAIAMLALPYTTHAQKHVRADIFDPILGRWGRFLADLLTRALSIWALWILVERARLKALDAHEFGDATNMLELPLWPFYGLVALGMALCIIVFAVQFLTILLSGHAQGDIQNG
jgi:TRAP-type C4-dicarboxylate transport system permease small subunit